MGLCVSVCACVLPVCVGICLCVLVSVCVYIYVVIKVRSICGDIWGGWVAVRMPAGRLLHSTM